MKDINDNIDDSTEKQKNQLNFDKFYIKEIPEKYKENKNSYIGQNGPDNDLKIILNILKIINKNIKK